MFTFRFAFDFAFVFAFALGDVVVLALRLAVVFVGESFLLALTLPLPLKDALEGEEPRLRSDDVGLAEDAATAATACCTMLSHSASFCSPPPRICTHELIASFESLLALVPTPPRSAEQSKVSIIVSLTLDENKISTQ